MAVRKTKKGLALKRWFKEDWKDVSTGKACGRKKGDGRSTPYCRPSKRVSTKTPKTSGEMTAAQKKSRVAQKKSLGQPAGKPLRVASLTRRNTVKKMNEGGKVKKQKRDIFADFERQRQLQKIERIRGSFPEDAKEMELEMRRKDKASGYTPKKMKEGGMLKAVPQNKKKSLGKLPTPVREKMGFMKEGGDVNKRSRGKFGRKLEGPPPKKQTRSEKRGGVPTEEQRLRMESRRGEPKRRKRGVPTSDLGGSRMRASKGAEQPRSRSALAELGGEKIERKPMKEGGMVIVDRQYLKGK